MTDHTMIINRIIQAASEVHNIPEPDIRNKNNRRGPTIDAKFHAAFMVDMVTGIDDGKIMVHFGCTGKSHMNHVRRRVLNLWDTERSYRLRLYEVGGKVGYDRPDVDAMVTRCRRFVDEMRRPKR